MMAPVSDGCVHCNNGIHHTTTSTGRNLTYRKRWRRRSGDFPCCNTFTRPAGRNPPAGRRAKFADMDSPRRTLLVVYHSWTGSTEQMSRAVLRGAAQEPAVATRLVHARDAGPDDLLAADGYVFATPENLAAIAGLMKDFFDRSYYAALDRLNGRPYAALVCAGSDGSNAARQIARIATGWRLREIAPPLIVCTHAQTPEAILAPKVVPEAELARGEELGAAFATGLAIGAF